MHKKFAKPNVFVVFNRWDCIDGEEQHQEDTHWLLRLQQQHLDATRQLLSEEEMKDKVFFISAKETLLHRLKMTGPVRPSFNSPAAMTRFKDFERFEEQFQECISSSAIQTRFQSHVEKGLQDARYLQESFLKVRSELTIAVEGQVAHLAAQRTRLECIHTNFISAMNSCNALVDEQATQLQKLITNKIAKETSSSLSSMILSFPEGAGMIARFNPRKLEPYKSAILSHIQMALKDHLDTCTALVTNDCFRVSQENLYCTMQKLVPDKDLIKRFPMRATSSRVPINCEGLGDNFQENLEFRFSFSPIKIFYRFFSPQIKNAIEAVSSLSDEKTLLASEVTQKQLSDPPAMSALNGIVVSCFLATERYLSTPMGSVMGGVFVVASQLIPRSLVRLIVGSGLVVFGGFYIYERIFYTRSAKERRFKLQLIDHSTVHFNKIATRTSDLVGLNIKHDLSNQLAMLMTFVKSTEKELQLDINKNEIEIKKITDAIAEAKMLQAQVEGQILGFQQFLQIHLPLKK